MKNSFASLGLRLILEWANSRISFLQPCARNRTLGHICFPVIGFGAIFFVSDRCHSATTIPGEEQAGVYYAFTHLPLIAYFVLGFIFLLSAANLWFQVRTARRTSSTNSFFAHVTKTIGELRLSSLIRGGGERKERRSRDANDGRSRRLKQVNEFIAGSGIVGIPRLSENNDSYSRTPPPTPLDGINHPMPQFFEPTEDGPSHPGIPDDQLDKRALLTEFRFSAAVDFPSPQEIERREKEQVVVSGSVKGPDGKGLSSVLVYLTDLEGTRVGQSCRSDPETGEFRVLANEPGKYLLKAHKRGLVLEDGDSSSLPIESGKIEGYNLRMVPEGCVVQGRVVSRSSTDTVLNLEVRCACKSSDFVSSVQTDFQGFFRISGVPANSECVLELYGPNGQLLSRSPRFETVQKKEIYRELLIADEREVNGAISSEVDHTVSRENALVEIPKQA